MGVQIPMFYGIGERDRILAAMQENHALYLMTLRSFAREIAYRNGSVTVDDVRALVIEREFPMPNDIGADSRIFGCVLSGCKDFIVTGQRVSTRPERIMRAGVGASYISVYVLKSSSWLGSTTRSVPPTDTRSRGEISKKRSDDRANSRRFLARRLSFQGVQLSCLL
jgi:hypothetical protein